MPKNTKPASKSTTAEPRLVESLTVKGGKLTLVLTEQATLIAQAAAIAWNAGDTSQWANEAIYGALDSSLDNNLDSILARSK